jgi:NAD(P)-dependent dehydrogenase (short-subunit alcohol dehydrogenase family)
MEARSGTANQNAECLFDLMALLVTPFASFRWVNNMNVLVTGGSRGIGRATALLAGARGWSVGINYVRDAAAADATVEEVQKAGGKAIKLKYDITQEDQVEEMFKHHESHFGPLSGVVVNAGITARAVPLAEFTTDRMRKVLDTNVWGSYLCAREASRRLGASSKDNRNIVFVSSIASKLGSPNEYVDYAGSKGAIDTLTIGLSKELGPKGIRVNCVRPGIIKTDIHEYSGVPNRAEIAGGASPMGRPGEASEVGEAIIWLLSTKASYVTGALLDVTGGR